MDTPPQDTKQTGELESMPEAPQHIKAHEQTKQQITPATLILQWLTYAFWGLTILALSILTFIVIFNLINGSESGSASLYTLAAIIVLLPISLVCDVLYQKREPHKKTGATAAILAIHAVIFALCGIGVLITGLFAVVQLMTDTNSSSQTDSAVARLVSSLIVAVLYGLVFVRTLNPFKKSRFYPKLHAIIMSIVIITFAVLAIVGPFTTSMKTKTDRFITSNIHAVNNAIDEYTSTNQKLPENLEQLQFYGDEEAQQLVDKNLVSYKIDPSTPDKFRYQLCVTYAVKENTKSRSISAPLNTYTNYLSTTGHPAGDVCYKLETSKQNGLKLFNSEENL